MTIAMVEWMIMTRADALLGLRFVFGYGVCGHRDEHRVLRNRLAMVIVIRVRRRLEVVTCLAGLAPPRWPNIVRPMPFVAGARLERSEIRLVHRLEGIFKFGDVHDTRACVEIVIFIRTHSMIGQVGIGLIIETKR